jgi:hypothetical protein
LDSTAELNGFALEGPVAQHLRAWCDHTRTPHQLHYWHTRTGLEVGFILYGESGLFAVEVKNSNRVRPEDSKGLRAFAQDYPQSRNYFLYRGGERLLRRSVMSQASATLDVSSPPDAVWSLIGGFNSLPDWIPGIPKIELSDGGRVRHFSLPGGQPCVGRMSTCWTAEREKYS